MDAWLENSAFWAVGIYISGNSRWCRNQPNLTPTWVSTQLAKGWRLLPITLGPQAWCHPGFPRYKDDPVIKKDPADNYAKAKAQGVAEAKKAVKAAQALGIVETSTLWYDLEAFNTKKAGCRASAMQFLSGWTEQLHRQNYVSGRTPQVRVASSPSTTPGSTTRPLPRRIRSGSRTGVGAR